jgi:hypothetical protein
MNNKEKEKGFIYAVALIIGALVALKVFWGFDIITFFKMPGVQESIGSFIDLLKSFWEFLVVSVKKMDIRDSISYFMDLLRFIWEYFAGFFENNTGS